MNPASSPLHLLQVNSLFSGGGADNQTLDLAAGLANLGDQVTLSVPAGSRWEPLARRLAGVRIETFAPRSPLKLAMIRSWIRLIRLGQIQIIHAHQGRDYWPTIIAARLAGRSTRVLVTRHLMTRPRALSRWLLLSQADVIAVSKAVLAVLQRDLRGPAARLHQIYGGIDTTKFQPVHSEAVQGFRRQQGWAPDDVVFGVVGAFDQPPGKGQLDFLEAAARLKTACPAARFAIVGKGGMEQLLRERITALDLDRIAVLVPFCDDVAAVLNALDVLVHPAVGTEALGLVIWEAMACGKPVIASRLDGITEAFVENEHGFLVPPGDAPALVGAMHVLLAKPELRARFGAAGREWVCQNFSQEIQARRMHQLYLRLLSRQ